MRKQSILFGMVLAAVPLFTCAQDTKRAHISTQADQSAETVEAIRRFGDWYLRCVPLARADNGQARRCEVAQIEQVRQGDSVLTVLSLALAKVTPEKGRTSSGFMLTAIAPLDVYLPEGLRFSLSDKDIMQLAYSSCNEAGCRAQQALDKKMLAALKNGNEATAHFQLADRRNVSLSFSLNGLTAALGALDAERK